MNFDQLQSNILSAKKEAPKLIGEYNRRIVEEQLKAEEAKKTKEKKEWEDFVGLILAKIPIQIQEAAHNGKNTFKISVPEKDVFIDNWGHFSNKPKLIANSLSSRLSIYLFSINLDNNFKWEHYTSGPYGDEDNWDNYHLEVKFA
jgi:hypothetical protein